MVSKKKRIFAFSVILAILFLSMVNGSNSVAAAATPSSAGDTQMQGDGLTFNIQKGDPIPQYPVQYGAIIPDTNMWTSYVVDASNQGGFKIKDWEGSTEETMVIDNPGDDISLISPWYFEDYYLDSLTDNDYVNPWEDIKWIQANASISESDTLMPYTVNSIWNYYVMTEASPLTVPIKDSIPIQVDMIITSTGPKVLKCDLKGTDIEIDGLEIVSPSGKEVSFENYQALFQWSPVFWYYVFVAREVGTYRLLLQEDDTPDDLNIEFLNFDLNTLPLNSRKYGGTCDETPIGQDWYDSEWKTEWWKFSGNKGDKFMLEIWEDFSYSMGPPTTDFRLFYPTCDGYIMTDALNLNEIYLPITGDFYIAVVHNNAPSLYRYSLLLKQIPVIGYNIGDELTSVKILKDERKAIEFEIPQDSFVRFNYTFNLALPTGTTTQLGDFIFEDAKKFGCHEEINPIDTKTVAGEVFDYYYMPEGKYEAIIKNSDVTKDGIFQISSNFVDWATDDIPINTLTFPESYPAQSMTIEFEPDEFDSSLKQAKVLTFDVTGPGQFYLNTTMLDSENLAAIPSTASPSHTYTYNYSADTFYSGDPQPVYSTDGTTILDAFLIGSPQKFTGVHFNFTAFGDGIDITFPWLWNGVGWNYIGVSAIDGTNHLSQNGTIDFAIDAAFGNWKKGFTSHPFGGAIDIPMVNENDFYWLCLVAGSDYTGNIPIIDFITLLNMTFSGDINLKLLRDSGYEHCDVWWPADIDQPAQITNFMLSQDEDIAPYESDSSPIIQDGDPWTIGIEEGTYKLLVIPEKWDYPGNINISFAVVDYSGYSKMIPYNIDSQPLAYPWNITDGTIIPGLHLYNYDTYPFEPSEIINNNYIEILDGEGYFVLDCYGSAYNWTQLVVKFKADEISTGNTIGDGDGIDGVDIYLMQDLPWVDNSGPNNEVMPLALGLIENKTIEFGVFSDHFYLIFEYVNEPTENLIEFWIDLNQYHTGKLTTTAPVASGISILGVGGGDDDDDDDEEVSLSIPIWVIIGVIAVIGAGAAGIIIYLKKKGRFLSKKP